MIRSNIADIRHSLPDNHNKILPVLKDDRCAVRLRVYHLAAELIDGTAHRLTEESIVNFLNGYQEESPLTIAELWVYPLMLRLVLAERLRRLTERASLRQHQKESADFWADRFLNAAERTVPEFDEMVAELGRRGEPITPHFIERLGKQLHQEETALVPIQNWIQEKTGHWLVDVIRREQTDESSELMLIAGAIGSLRELSELQYPRIVESVCRMERILQEDPAGIHGRSDFATRDRCRQAVETVARAAVQLARGGEEGSCKGCVGYYLLDAGKLELEARLESRVTWREGRLRFLRRYPTCVYIGTLVGLTTGLSTAFGVVAYRAGLASEGVLLLLGILALFPASELATYLLHLVLTSMLPPRVLPKMSFEKGIPEDCRTLVVVPMMLLTPDSIQGEVDKLEVRYFSNPEENVWYSLLSDFTDATEREMLEDDGLLGLAMKLVEGLGAEAGEAGGVEPVAGRGGREGRFAAGGGVADGYSLCDSAGRGYAASARLCAAAGGDDCASVEPGGTDGGRAGPGAGLHDYSTAGEHYVAFGDGDSIYAIVYGCAGDRSLLAGGFGCLSRFIRGGDLSREGDL